MQESQHSRSAIHVFFIAVRDRMDAVAKTQKITVAMRLVAASRVKQAQEAAEITRPFSDAVQASLRGILRHMDEEFLEIPLLTQREVKKVTLVVITSDRGLCGGFNLYIIKKAKARLETLKKLGVETDLILLGEKGIQHFQRRNYAIRAKYPTGQTPSPEKAEELADDLLSMYLSGETDAVELLYTRFENMLTSVPSVRTLIPLSASEITDTGDEAFVKPSTKTSGKPKPQYLDHSSTFTEEDMNGDNIEDEPAAFLDTLLSMYLHGQVLRALQESVASEVSSRMQSMQHSCDNADELMKGLQLYFNRARQSSVTAELMEVISGTVSRE